jgi:hypothetical protein
LSYFEKELVTLRFIDLLQPGDVVVDVGASMGIYSIHMAKRVKPIGKVISVEPDPLKVRRLSQNIELNGVVGHVIVVPKAVSEDIPLDSTTTTVAQLLQDVTVTGRVFVKIDTDGADLESLRSIGCCFENDGLRPHLIQIESRIDDSEIASFMRSKSYELAIHDWHRSHDVELLEAQPLGISWWVSRT